MQSTSSNSNKRSSPVGQKALLYGVIAALSLPVLYVLVSGPLQVKHWRVTNTVIGYEMDSLGNVIREYPAVTKGWIVDETRPWDGTLQLLFSPLQKIDEESHTGVALNWYWKHWR